MRIIHLPFYALLVMSTLLAVLFVTRGITLKWTASTTSGVTYSIYKSKTSPACSATSVPIKTGILGTQWIDSSVSGTWFYNVASVKNGKIACSAIEQQCQVSLLHKQCRIHAIK